jgi:hypothetical protein
LAIRRIFGVHFTDNFGLCAAVLEHISICWLWNRMHVIGVYALECLHVCAKLCILVGIVAYVCVAILVCFPYGELLMQASGLLLL